MQQDMNSRAGCSNKQSKKRVEPVDRAHANAAKNNTVNEERNKAQDRMPKHRGRRPPTHTSVWCVHQQHQRWGQRTRPTRNNCRAPGAHPKLADGWRLRIAHRAPHAAPRAPGLPAAGREREQKDPGWQPAKMRLNRISRPVLNCGLTG